ncbi:hypothetical protein V525_15070 [Gordonia alkanivorans CGMCC 6845]|uniref:Uncharacterized protein n=1 Tax=Gordonia alkanivorans CGMCC 6845 TaxID=1423140 RepID=W9DHY7_9ACTN|nr:hypothetical protein V525_15070 [Gordonia alkanivorans CGMCC 6845]
MVMVRSLVEVRFAVVIRWSWSAALAEDCSGDEDGAGDGQDHQQHDAADERPVH